MFRIILIALFLLQESKGFSKIDRREIQQELHLYKLSLIDGIIDPYYNTAIVKRRSRRQAAADDFPSDDEDNLTAAGSGEPFDRSWEPEQNLKSSFPNDHANAATDWSWFRISINFLNSIDFSTDLQDYRTDAFADQAFAVMKPIRSGLNYLLDGYLEAIPIAFRKRGENVEVVVDIGACSSITPDMLRGALKSLVNSGMIGQYLVSRNPPSMERIETERNKAECVPGPTLRPPVTASSTTTSFPPTTRHTMGTTSRTATSFPPTTRHTMGTTSRTTTSLPPTTKQTIGTTSSTSSAVPDRLESDSRTPSCRYDQATCQNLECIDRSYVCDGTPDCSDGSDEGEACTAASKQCDPRQFLCKGVGSCAQKIWMCDGDDDCGNGFDESNCGPPPPGSRCASNQFQCGDESCIPMSHLCDNDVDCSDGSDENNCSPPVAVRPPRRKVEAIEGETITLSCETSGNPKPVVSWRLNWGSVPPPPRITMTSDNGIGFLTIRKIKKSDQGAYTCEAMNIIESILATPDAIVIVHEKNTSKPSTPNEDQCPPGKFNASPIPPYICEPCYCSGVTDQCYPSKLDFSEISIDFTNPDEENLGVKLEPNSTIEGSPEAQQPVTNNQIRINPPAKELQLIDLSKRFLAAAHYWSLPAQFLGAKINSYGGTLTFSFSYNTSYDAAPSPTFDPDVIIEGGGNRLLYSYPGSHPEPEIKHTKSVKLSETDNWRTPDGKNVTRAEMMNVLQNIDRILLRTVYDTSMHSTGLGKVKFQVAGPVTDVENTSPSGDQSVKVHAYSVEECICPPEYTGMSCENCAPGYKRVLEGPLAGICSSIDEQVGTPPDTICEEGYTGPDCGQCEEGYSPYEGGCTRYPETYCEVAGSIGVGVNKKCLCKNGCEGERCDRCKPGYYHLSTENPDGCLPCFCMNLTDRCISSNWNRTQIIPSGLNSSPFLLKNIDTGSVFEDGITVEDTPFDGIIVSAPLERYPEGVYYWMLPQLFTGNQLASYGGYLGYTINYDEASDAVSLLGLPDVRIVTKDQILHYSDYVPNPRTDIGVVVEMREENWVSESGSPVSREDFLSALSNIKHFLVKASYSNNMRTSRIKLVSLESALPAATGGSRAVTVEQCFCPIGYSGLSCEDFSDGFYRVRTGKKAGTCQSCNCHNHANSCDKETGICNNCLHHTVGHHCSRCADGYYGNAKKGTPLDCKVCPCPILDGATGEGGVALCSVDCEGRPVCLRCPEGYEGKACDECSEGYEPDRRNPSLCVKPDKVIDCSCHPSGSVNRSCDVNRNCYCKPSTTGTKCDQCKPGYFYLDLDFDEGCLPCFCMGVTDQCTSSALRRNQITADFSDDYGGFRLTQQSCRTHVTDGYIVSEDGQSITYPKFDQLSKTKPYFWQLPNEYRDNKIVSYGGALDYKTAFLAARGGQRITEPDVILVGNGVMLLTKTEPRREVRIRPNTTINNKIVFREEFWETLNGEPATREQLLMALADVDSILVRATYWTTQLSASTSDFSMDTASNSLLMTDPAYEVEQCACPDGYTGTSCEECASGYTRLKQGLYLGVCQICDCNGHSSECDPATGRCLNCQDNTAGDQCEQCAAGYYGDATRGTSSDCSKCACPGSEQNSFSDTCQLDVDNSMYCTACREGYTGRRCERCSPGFEGNPSAVDGKCTRAQDLRIRAQPRNSIIKEGKSVVFVCQAAGTASNVVFTWTKHNGELPKSRSSDYGGILRIRNAQRTDAGTYICTGSNIHGSARAYTRLTVTPAEQGEKPSVQVTPTQQEVAQGGNAIFYCTARGSPAPIVEWTKGDGEPLPTNSHVTGNMLMLSSVNANDGSSYNCRASNSHGVVEATGALDVTITGSPPEVTILTETVMVMEGDTATLRCTASGVPTPLLTWSKDSEYNLPSNSRTAGGDLIISSSTLDNQGRYTCLARNGFGEDSGTAQLYVKKRQFSRPICRTDPKEITAYSGTNATINCVVGGNPMPSIHWETIDGSPLDTNIQVRGSELFIMDVQRDNAGNYVCVATNAFGASRSRMILHVVTKDPPQILISPQSRQSVTSGGDITFDCLSPGQDDVTMTWKRAGGREFTGDTYLSNDNRTLNIRGVTRLEAGNYVCTGSNVVGTRSSYAIVRVIELPIITLLPSRVVTATEGQTVRITCRASGHPTPSVIWYGGSPTKRLTNYRRRSNVYSLERVSMSDAGAYNCRAINEAGTSEENLILNVNPQAPQTPPVVVVPAATVRGVIGNPVELHCTASGNPTPRLGWVKVGGELPYGYRESDGTLYIGTLRQEDIGTYECVASNSIGSDRASVELVITVPPRVDLIVGGGKTDLEEGEELFLSCLVSGFPLPNVILEKDEAPVPLNDDGVYLVGSVTPIDSGIYQCIASSDAGIERDSKTISVIAQPSVRIEREIVEVTSGEILILRCQLNDEDVPIRVTWKKQNETLPDYVMFEEDNNLVINEVRVDDNGSYICVVEYERERIETIHDVFVDAFIPYLTQTPLSYVAVPLDRGQFYESVRITISFKPNILDGLLLFSNSPNRDFLSLSLNSGIVEFQFDLGSGHANIRSLTSVKLNQWHTVVISRSDVRGKLRLDDGPVISGRSVGGFRGFDLNSILYVGGVPNSFELPPSLRYLGRDVGFYGCISQLDIGNGLIDFGISRNVSEKVGVVRCKTCGARKRDDPCMNDGRCTETHENKNGYSCACKIGYVGDRCETSPSPSDGQKKRRFSGNRVRSTQLQNSQHASRFSEGSFALFRSKVFRHNDAAEQINLRFKTTNSRGLLLLHGQKLLPKPGAQRLICEKQGKHFEKCDFVKLAVEGSRLVYSFSIGGVELRSVSRNEVSDGLWHSVNIVRRGPKVGFWVDGSKQELTGETLEEEMSQTRVSGRIYIGGLPNRLAKANNQPFFDGCIADVKLSSMTDAQYNSLSGSSFNDNSERLDFGRFGPSKQRNLDQCQFDDN